MPTKIEIELPESLIIGNRRKYWRSHIAHIRRCIHARGTGQPDPPMIHVDPGDDELIGSAETRKLLNLSIRTYWRLVAVADAKAPAAKRKAKRAARKTASKPTKRAA
jgi:hypothetical protein